MNQQLPLLITPSIYMRDELLAIGFRPKRVEVNELYVDPPAPSPRLPSLGPPRILRVERMILPAKGADFLLESLARLVVPCHVDLVGHGPHFEVIAALSRKLDLTDRVTQHAWVEPHEGEALCLAPNSNFTQVLGTGPAPPAYSATIPTNTIFAGLNFYLQAILVDSVTFLFSTSNLVSGVVGIK